MSKKFTDDALGEPTTAIERASNGESAEIAKVIGDPTDFSFDDFADGARGTERAVRITNRGDLLSSIDVILSEANNPDITEERAEQLLAEVDELRHAIWDSQRVFVVQGRSPARRAKARQQAGIEPDKKATAERHVHYAQYSMLCELADAITVPSGVTPDALLSLYEECPGEVDKLWVAFNEACKSEGAPIVNFSQRR